MKSKGFTIIELLVITGLIGLMSAVLLPSFRTGDQELALSRSASKLSQDLRRVQEMALSAKETASGEIPPGYGIYFEPGTYPNQYFLFADLDGDEAYTAGEIIETVTLERKIKISDLSPTSPMSITFVSPNPDVVFSPVDSGLASIVLSIDGSGVFQYRYNVINFSYGLKTPRANLTYGVSANCDKLNTKHDCPSSFASKASEPAIVYDQTAAGTRSAGSYRYDKITTEIIPITQKTIEINKAGLITIEE